MRQAERTRRQTGRGRTTRASRYGSIESFYAADPRRLRSRERDVGLWWRDATDGPLHRAAWVCDTGELYVVRLGPREQGGGRVEVLARTTEHDQLERALAGWRGRCGEPQSLAWLRERARNLGGRVRTGRTRISTAAAGAGALLTAGLSLAVELA